MLYSGVESAQLTGAFHVARMKTLMMTVISNMRLAQVLENLLMVHVTKLQLSIRRWYSLAALD
jgi:hypothetical protein